jgi:putative FmdB family regulatory protein
MPLYEYRCDRCGQTFEVKQKFSDQPLTQHEGCGGSVERLLSPPALQFKGSGWYVTDYGKNGGGASKSDSTPKPEKPDKKTETKTESKSESKSESKPTSSSTSSTHTS